MTYTWKDGLGSVESTNSHLTELTYHIACPIEKVLHQCATKQYFSYKVLEVISLVLAAEWYHSHWAYNNNLGDNSCLQSSDHVSIVPTAELYKFVMKQYEIP